MIVRSLVILSVLISPAVGKVEMGTIPLELQSMFDSYKTETTVKETAGESIDFFVTEQYKWLHSAERWPRDNLTAESESWINTLRPDKADLAKGKNRTKRQANFMPRIRQEYRMMSVEARNNYHRAINMLKEDTLTAFPNKYEAFIELHTGMRSLAAHGGPAFFPYHRVFLFMFENALREKVPGVTVPYWDFTMDEELPDPSDSIMWGPEFCGSGSGLVTDGPFANWRLRSGPLVRNIGGGGPMMSHRDIEMILRQRSLAQITYPSAKLTNYEFLHSGMHRHCGGNMGTLETAAQDPIFFPMHAFADNVWEQMRERQRGMGMDPEDDYPVHFGAPFHGPNELMGLGPYRNIDGMHNYFSEIIRYERSPTCSRRNLNCGSPYLRCNKVTFRCVPISRSSVNSCSMRGLNRPTQNIFAMNGRGDVANWAFMTVKVITSRPPEFKDYGAYPITNGAAQFDNDIYSPFGYAATRNMGHDEMNSARGWSSCRRGGCCGGANEVFVQSNGLNYDGAYKASALVDQRFVISSSVAYVAVKHPQRGQSIALLRAFDGCGRMCSAACKVPGSYPERYEPCNGVVTVSSGEPYMFGNNFGESLMGAWDFSVNKDCPTFRSNEIFLAFYCDYSPAWPFEADGRRRMNTPIRPHNPAGTLGSIHEAHSDHGFGGIHRVVPKGLNKCEIDSVCLINSACSGCRQGTIRHCISECSVASAMCEHGEWVVRQCPPGMFFDQFRRNCIPGSCVLTSDGGFAPNTDPLMSAIGMLSPNLVGSLSQQTGTGGLNSIPSLLSWLRGTQTSSGLNQLSGAPSVGSLGSLTQTGSLGTGMRNPGSLLTMDGTGMDTRPYGTNYQQTGTGGISSRLGFQQSACNVGDQCRVQASCSNCKYREKKMCDKTCRWYAECINGRFIRRPCPPGTHFDAQRQRCMHGESCQRNTAWGQTQQQEEQRNPLQRGLSGIFNLASSFGRSVGSVFRRGQ